jgi:hypothetical protein
VRGERGQALVELIAGMPILVTIGLSLLQLLAAGYSAVLAGNAAEAAALAVAAESDPKAAMRAALPGWSEAGARLDVGGATVVVHVRPPSPIEAVARGLEVERRASVVLP